MSQIHYSFISLEEMVRRSSIIVTARKASPFTRSEDIPLKNKVGENKKLELPPYRKMYWSFNVLEILKGKGGEVKKGLITVTEAHFDASLKIHTSWHLDGLSRSPDYQAYNSNINISDLDEAILFLNNFNELHYAFDFAWESVDRKKEIKKLIRKTGKKGIIGRLS